MQAGRLDRARPKDMMTSPHKFWERPNWLFCLLLPLFHYASIKLTYLCAVTPENVVVFWLGNAVLLAAILRFRGKRAPLLAALTYCSDVLANQQVLPLHVAMLLGLVNQAEVFLIYWLLVRYQVSVRLRRVQDFAKFIVIAPGLAAMLAGLTAAVVMHHVAGFPAPYFTLARLWWFSDALGLFIYTPLLLALTFPQRQPVLTTPFERATLVGVLLVTAAVMSAQGGAIDGVSATPTLLLPVVAVVALRLGTRITTLYVAAVAMGVAMMTTNGLKPFGEVPVHLAVVRTQEFIVTLCMIGIGFAMLIKELKAREHDLEARVRERTRELEESNERLMAMSATDGLTGIANRRRFDEMLASEWSRARRAGQPLTLAMLDVDMFKQYNDSCGHQAGDEVLRRVAAELTRRIRRSGDTVARYGGEEFAIIAQTSGEDNALAMADLICRSVAELALPHPASPFGVVTVSVGVAVIAPHENDSIITFLKAADMALYRAKMLGRNRVALADMVV